MNKLETLMRWRFYKSIAIHTAWIIALCLAVFIYSRASAAGSNANPTNAPGFPGYPSSIYSPGLDGTEFMWFRGVPSGGGGSPAVQTCVAVTSNSSFTMYHNIPFDAAVSSIDGSASCWNGSSWSSFIVAGTCNVQNMACNYWFESGDLDANVLTTVPIYQGAISGNVNGSYGSAYTVLGVNVGNKTNGQLIMAANTTNSNVDLYFGFGQGTGAILIGQDVLYGFDWSGAPFNISSAFFFEDAEETNYQTIFTAASFGTSGSWAVRHSYAFDGNYQPVVAVGNSSCVTPTSSGCTLIFSSVGEAFTQVKTPTQLNDAYSSVFTASKYNDVLVGQSINFHYELNSSYCEGSSITGRRLFLGYLSGVDAGAVLGASSGSTSLSFSRTNAPVSDFFYPRVHVYCADGSFWDVWLGGSVTRGEAQGISVYQPGDDRFSMPSSWLNGGYSADFSTSTGSMFFSDKNIYLINEPVKLKFLFRDSSVNSLRLYGDADAQDLLATLTGSYTTPSVQRYLTITYSEEGTYQPILRVCFNSGCSFRRDIYLGGEDSPNPVFDIVVSRERSTLWTNNNSGGILGIFAGTGSHQNTGDFFSLEAFDFKGFGATGNPFLDAANSALMVVFRAIMYAAKLIYSILARSSTFNFLLQIMHPQDGSCYYLPTTLFRLPTPDWFSAKSFCIEYNTDPRTQIFTDFAHIAFAISIGFFVITHLTFSKK